MILQRKYETKFWKIGLCIFKPTSASLQQLRLTVSLHITSLSIILSWQFTSTHVSRGCGCKLPGTQMVRKHMHRGGVSACTLSQPCQLQLPGTFTASIGSNTHQGRKEHDSMVTCIHVHPGWLTNGNRNVRGGIFLFCIPICITGVMGVGGGRSTPAKRVRGCALLPPHSHYACIPTCITGVGRGGAHLQRGCGDVHPSRSPFHAFSATHKISRWDTGQFTRLTCIIWKKKPDICNILPPKWNIFIKYGNF